MVTAAPVSVGQRELDLDVYDPDRYIVGVPHEALAWMRANDPLYWHEEPGEGVGYWAVTKLDDIAMMSKDPKTFSSFAGGTNIEDYPAQDLQMIRLMMLNMDPPAHAKFRRIVRRGFTPRQVTRLEPRIRASAKRLIDQIASRGECEFVEAVAAELPLLVIADLIGIPEEDRHKVFHWTNGLIGFDDPEFNGDFNDVKASAMQMWAYANGLAARRHLLHDDDLVCKLLDGDVDGEKLTVLEFDAFFLLLAVAGNETTRNLISGAVRALHEHPDQRQRLVDDPSLIPTAVEEFLRWVTPVTYMRRTCMADIIVRGKTIEKGDKVALYYASANRDEDHFEDPFAFDVGRTPNEHLAFGVGEHFCMGASLARLEITILFEELIRRLPDFEVVGEPKRLRSNFVNGIKQLNLRFTPEAAAS